MSDMKTFTVRDLDRSPAKVLAAADRDGIARVRSRTGRTYAVKPETTAAPKPDWAAFAQERRMWLKKHFPNGPIMTREQAADFDRLISDDRPVL